MRKTGVRRSETIRTRQDDNSRDNVQNVRADSSANLHGRLLLVHGTSDDNVHMQNTVQLIHALVEAGKGFDVLLYPEKTHSISGAKAREHLFRSLAEYLEEHL